MPTYDYKCEDCHKSFIVVLTIGQHDHKKVRCPKCGSTRVQQKVSSFFVVTSRKS